MYALLMLKKTEGCLIIFKGQTNQCLVNLHHYFIDRWWFMKPVFWHLISSFSQAILFFGQVYLRLRDLDLGDGELSFWWLLVFSFGLVVVCSRVTTDIGEHQISFHSLPGFHKMRNDSAWESPTSSIWWSVIIGVLECVSKLSYDPRKYISFNIWSLMSSTMTTCLFFDIRRLMTENVYQSLDSLSGDLIKEQIIWLALSSVV